MRHLLVLCLCLATLNAFGQSSRARDLGLEIGVMSPGDYNAITDVEGIKVGHQTLIDGTDIRTGVTAILPHNGNLYQDKIPAAIYIGNGYGKLMGYSQVEELGTLETPIILTNTLSVPVAANALIKYTLLQEGNENVRSVNALVGETNDGYLNDIRGMHVTEYDVMEAIHSATGQEVTEGNVGAGTGTICFGFKGGIGTSSRKMPISLGGYTVGVLVQSNFGGVLTVDGIPVGKELEQYPFQSALQEGDGSCMIVVATDAPLDARNLKRLAKRAFLGLGHTGGIASNGSGDYVIAFSTAPSLRSSHSSNTGTEEQVLLRNDAATPLFMAAIEATEEAIINSLLAAQTMTGFNGHVIEALPRTGLMELIKTHRPD